MKQAYTFLFSIATLFLSAQTARIQAIHNSADAAASTVDVYLSLGTIDSLLIDDFAFRTASPFIDAPAGTPFTVSIAPGNSTGISDTITGLSNTYTLTAGMTYILVAEGIVSPSGYSPATPFGINVYAMGQESAMMSSNTDVLVHHGSTDAPIVDVVERTAGKIVDNLAYGDFQGYLQLPTADYTLDIQDSANSTTVVSYSAPLQTLNLGGEALVVVASGFLNPANNSNGPAFGLYVALPSGGALVALPTAPLGVDEARAFVFNLFPNPTTGMLNIEMENLETARIYSIDGQLQMNIDSRNLNQIDVSALSNGIYLLELTNTQGLREMVRFSKR